MTVRSFYDALAPWYHLIFADWERSIERQARALHDVIRARWQRSAGLVWDAAAGIGTQAIGLSRLGYPIVASDVSHAALRRARDESARRGARLSCVGADMREPPFGRGRVDLILACDNAVPHLLTAAEIGGLFQTWHACLPPGGAFLISLRDYGVAAAPGVEETHEYGTRSTGERTLSLRQRWRWQAGGRYRLIFEFEDVRTGELVAHPEAEYLAISPSKVVDLARHAGFADAAVVPCEFYQPVLWGSRTA